ncbi:AraC family transcriptional regulator [Flavobacterium chuncheonense]|uniref:AraC family transcriptional regulator n=1 Tax=Flavobacterium chuncheonense TaxID=2026653 RepID=A0ABW5YIV9_9FLAO
MNRYPIYNINNFERNTFSEDLYVNSFRMHFQKHGFIESMHRHNFYLLVFFTNGSGIHTIDFDTFSVQRGSLFVMQPGQMHTWSLSDDTDGYIVFCSKEVFNLYFQSKAIEDYAYFKSFKNVPDVLLSDAEIKKINFYFELMLLEYQNEMLYKKDKILNLLDVVFIEISRLSTIQKDNVKSNYGNKLKQFELVLEQNFKTEKAPSFYADALSISLKHLNRITKEILNETVTALITQRVLLESKRYMVEGNLTTSQIADLLGFSSASYFLKLFKKHTGQTPKSFKNGLKD